MLRLARVSRPTTILGLREGVDTGKLRGTFLSLEILVFTHPSGDDTINSSYAIDPVRNGGVNFQFAEVVRGKEDRRRLQAGDCESCRDYYEAIGPLPARLQPPLWRSPPTSPTKHTTHTCRHGHKNDREVAAHKQAISRHREEWAQGSTPPGYWDIGFPTTQEADDINARAKEMHKQKMNRVREDAEGGGRYYKTR
ncbi:DNA repair protein endonuclease SAE2/CtIP C-terminus-domain-containing protein [Mycena amicta]|nr:DNA repair protein endonuclease SAE2/CtIP C-terminus-domain-containing protein [Mycena amicta]